MAHVDAFLMQLVAPSLEPGEAVMGVGLLRSPKNVNALGIAEQYANFLGVATDRRLVVFETDIQEFLKAKPSAQPVATKPRQWRYDELQAVRVAPVKAVMFETRGAATAVTLIPEIGCGPYAEDEEPGRPHGRHKRYDVFEEIGGLDGQARMYREFPQWLAQRVEARAFPMSPERRAEVAARIARRGAQQIEEGVAHARRSKALRSDLVLAVITLAALVLLGFGVLFTKGGIQRRTSAEDDIASLEKEIAVRERDLATWLRDPKGVPPSDCPDRKWIAYSTRTVREPGACHGCRVVPTDKGATPPPPHFRTFQREGRPWACPDVSSYASTLANVKNELGGARKRSDDGATYLVLGIALLLAAAAVFAGGLIVRGRMKRKAAATAQAA